MPPKNEKDTNVRPAFGQKSTKAEGEATDSRSLPESPNPIDRMSRIRGELPLQGRRKQLRDKQQRIEKCDILLLQMRSSLQKELNLATYLILFPLPFNPEMKEQLFDQGKESAANRENPLSLIRNPGKSD